MTFRNIGAWGWPILLVGLVWALCSAPAVQAADAKPVVAVSIGGYDAIWKAVDSIADRMGYKQNVVGFRSIVADVQGLDKKKPGGVVVVTDGKELFPFGFLPVKKIDNLLFMGVESLRQSIEEIDGAKILHIESAQGKADVELLERGDWLFFFEKGKSKSLPSGDPSRFLDGIEQISFLGGKFWCENLSTDLLDCLFSLARQRLAEPAAQTAVDWQMLKKYGDTFLASVETMTFVCKTDDAGSLTLESNSKLKPGSELATVYAKGLKQESLWGHIYQPTGAVCSLLVAAQQPESNREYQATNVGNTFKNMYTSLAESLDEADLKRTKKVVAPLQELITATVSQDNLDGALTVTPDPLIVLGQTVVDGEKMIEFLKLLDKEVLVDEPVKGRLKVASEKIGDYSISSFVFPFSVLEKKAKEEAASSGVPPMFSGRDLACYVASRSDAIICVFGLDQKKAYEKIKDLASRKVSKTAVLTQEYYLSAKGIGALLKNLKLNELPEMKDYNFILDILVKADANARIFGKVSPESELVVSEKVCIDGSVYAVVGDVIRGFISQNNKGQESKKKDDLKESDSLFDN